ncbi:hypothetical protein V2G26_008289 [Clonostachys chloroleuca]
MHRQVVSHRIRWCRCGSASQTARSLSSPGQSRPESEVTLEASTAPPVDLKMVMLNQTIDYLQEGGCYRLSIIDYRLRSIAASVALPASIPAPAPVQRPALRPLLTFNR